MELVKFVRAARYQSMMASDAAYRKLHAAVLEDERIANVGMAHFIYKGVATILVTAHEPLPADVVAVVDEVLAETGEPWVPTDEVVACIVLRRARQVVAGEARSAGGPAGSVELHRRGQFQGVDRYGRDVGNP